jgi:hypothetical protein
MASKKKKNSAGSGPLSATAYISSGNARKLPLSICMVNENWKELGLAQVIVSRKHVTGNLTGAIFIVDLYCCGVKDAMCFFNREDDYVRERALDFSEKGIIMQHCEYSLAHNIIYGAVEFADEFGIKPHKDYTLATMILEEDDERVELIDIEFGNQGKPRLVAHMMDDRTKYYLRQLKTHAGEGNFEFVLIDDPFGDDDEDEDDFEDEDMFEDEDDFEEDDEFDDEVIFEDDAASDDEEEPKRP